MSNYMTDNILRFCSEAGTSIIKHSKFKAVSSVIVGFFTWFVGVNNASGLLALFILCVLDVMFSLYIIYKKDKQFSSREFPKKVIDIVIYIILIGTVNVFAKTTPLFSFGADVLITWFALTQVISILEHATELGYKLPIPLLGNLKKVRQTINEPIPSVEITKPAEQPIEIINK